MSTGFMFNDEGFERVCVSALRAIGSSEFEAVRQFVEASEPALLANPIDGKAAVSSIFDAVENLYKQIFPKAPHLSKANLQNHLKPTIETQYAGEENKNARRSSLKQVEALADWADGAHEYRHAPGTPESSPPSEHMAMFLVSQDLAYLRCLAELKKAIQESP